MHSFQEYSCSLFISLSGNLSRSILPVRLCITPHSQVFIRPLSSSANAASLKLIAAENVYGLMPDVAIVLSTELY